MKLKTHKATAKKIKITGTKRRKNKKFMTKRAGQDHFNARESGNVTRSKRRRQTLDPTNVKTAKRMLPYA